MITKSSFLKQFNGHGNAYSSYMVIDVKLEALIRVLNEIDPDMCVGSGQISDTGRSIYFEICKELPELMADISEKLHCKGFADIAGWYGDGHFEAYADGEEFNDFTAKWDDDQPIWLNKDAEDEESEWDAFVTVTDNQSGETFYTGEGAISYESALMWKELVETHQGGNEHERKIYSGVRLLL